MRRNRAASRPSHEIAPVARPLVCVAVPDRDRAVYCGNSAGFSHAIGQIELASIASRDHGGAVELLRTETDSKMVCA